MKYVLTIIIIVGLSVNILPQTTLEQRLLVVQNDGLVGGIFSFAYQVKGTNLTSANTLGSATADINYDNTKLSYTSFSDWAFGSGDGYSRFVNNIGTYIRIGVAGLGVNENGGGDPPGFDIGSSYTTWVQVNFTILQDNTTTNLTIDGETNDIGLFGNHANDPLSDITNQTLSSPINILNELLPVELTSFTLSVSDNSVLLKWITETEVNNYGFEIERTMKVENMWRKIGFIEGAGYSNSRMEYLFNDHPGANGTYSYRLKQIDNDGSFHYGPTIEAEINFIPDHIKLFQNYPNPFNPVTKIRFSLPRESEIALELFNTLGQRVSVLAKGLYSAGEHETALSGLNLSSGSYFYVLTSGKNKLTRKLTILK